MTDNLEVIRDIAVGFDTHDLDRIMVHFTDDAVFEAPRGSEAYGRRVVGIDAVDAALDEAVAAGGSILKPGTDLPFGYGGYFTDPDGHPWEVCFNPGFPIRPDGRIEIA